jgi:hypothetical protein
MVDAKPGLASLCCRPKATEGDACGCEQPKANQLRKVMLWVATIVVIGFWSFPFIAAKLLR